jgi:hypothetical protein
MAGRLADAPAAIAGALPDSVDDVIAALHGAGTGASAGAYLRESIDLATRHLFLGMAVISALVFLVLLVVPRHFPERTQEALGLDEGHLDRG